MSAISLKNMWKRFYDPSLGQVETPQGVLSLPKLFLPFFLEMFLMNLMSTVNTFTLSFYSDQAVAAVGAAGQFMGMVMTFYSVISTGASIVISQNLGARHMKNASDAAFCALVIGCSISFLLSMILSALAAPLMSLMNLEGKVLGYAVSYFRLCIRFPFLASVVSVSGAIFKSYGRPKISVCVTLCMNAINALLNYLVIFRPVEFPLHGVTGIACSYIISESCAAVVMLVLLIKIPLGLDFRHKSLQSLRMIKKVLRIGIPGGISSLSYSVSQVVTTSIIALVGVTAVSAKIYVSTIVFYVYVLGLSLGLTTSLMTSWLVGAGNYEQAYRLNLQNLKITVTLNAVLSTLLALFGYSLLKLFTDDPQILSMGHTILFIDIFVEIFRGFNHIEENSLRGAGDVVFPMVVSMISCWIMSVFISYLLGVHFGFGLIGCWIAFGMDEAFRGINYFRRWKSRKWMQKRQV